MRVAEEHDTHSLKRGVIGPARSHSDNVSVSILPSCFTRAHSHIPLFPRKLPGLRGRVWGASGAGEHDMLIKREVIGLVRSSGGKWGELMCTVCQHWWENAETKEEGGNK